MEKKLSTYTRKALSVFMAFMMVFSMFVFAPEMFTKAEAATAGNYYVRITWVVDSKNNIEASYAGWNTSVTTDSAGFTLRYKTNNGTGTQQDVNFNVGSKNGGVSGTYVSAATGGNIGSTGTKTATCVINGFPTGLFVAGKDNIVWFSGGLEFYVSKIEIGKSTSYGTTLWSGKAYVASTNTGHYCYVTAAANGTSAATLTPKTEDSKYGYISTSTNNWKFPYANDISSFSISPTSVTVPTSSTAATVTASMGTITDQYGVNWYQDPYVAVSGPTGVDVSNRTTVSVSNSAMVAASPFSKTVTVTAHAGSETGTTVGSSKTLTITNPTYTVTWKYKTSSTTATAGDASKTSTAYYNETPTNAPDGIPTGYYTSAYHYSDGKFRPQKVTGDVAFEMSYTEGEHVFGNYKSAGEDTRKHTKECSCGYKVTEDCYDWSSEVITQPTCLTQGTTKYTCKNCGNIRTAQDIGKISHNYNGDAVHNENSTPSTHSFKCTADANCTSYGATENCTFKSEVTKQPACGVKGQTTYTCEKCSYSYTEDIEALEHVYPTEWTVRTNPNCVDTGLKFKKCTRTGCDEEITDIIPVEPGVHKSLEKLPAVESTCTSTGLTDGWHCTACGITTEPQQTVAKKAHSTVKVAAVAATCQASGNNEYWECSVCHNVFKDKAATQPTTAADETIAKKDHSYTGAYLYDEATKTHKQMCVNGCMQYGEAVACSVTSQVISQPTCTANGTTKFTCSQCGGTYTTSEPAAAGHSWDAGTVTLEATCQHKGVKTFKCTVAGCDAEKAEDITQLSHDYSGAYLYNAETKKHQQMCVNGCNLYGAETACSFTSEITKQPDCTEAGVKTFTCSVCAGTYTEEVEKLGHSFTSYTSNGDATCTADGTKTAKCDRCDVTDTKKDEESALGHDYVGVVTDPTCVDKGYTTYTCSRCPDTYTADETQALGHSFTSYTSNGDAKCLENGTETAKCDRCDVTDTRTEENSALGHSFTNYVSNGDATCTADGTKTAKCDRCDVTDTQTDEGSALGHSMVKTDAVAATCFAGGNNEYYTCSVCSNVYKDEAGLTQTTAEAEKTAKLQHNNVLTKTVPSTCVEQGYVEYTCSLCGTITCVHDTNPLPPHNFVATEIPATCTTKSGMHFECSVCHLNYDVLDGEYAPHTWKSEWTVTVEPTCVSTGEKAHFCSVCGAKGATTTLPKLPHHIDETNVVDYVTASGYDYLVYDCTICGNYKAVQFVVNAKDSKGNKLVGATVKVTDSQGTLVATGKTSSDGTYITDTVLFKEGSYTVTIKTDDNHSSVNVLKVSKNGSVSGSILPIEVGTGACKHLCHKGWFGELIRKICTFFSYKFGRTIKCCDDMEWAGKYAEYLK